MRLKIFLAAFFIFIVFLFTAPLGKADAATMCCPNGYGDSFFACPFFSAKPCCKWLGFGNYDLKDKILCSDVNAVKTPCGLPSASSCPTAVGNISTQPSGVIRDIFRIILTIGGSLAVLLIILSGYKLMTSQGNPDRVQAAKEQFTSAIIGLLFIVFSFVILQIIGVDILAIPGFG